MVGKRGDGVNKVPCCIVWRYGVGGIASVKLHLHVSVDPPLTTGPDTLLLCKHVRSLLSVILDWKERLSRTKRKEV
jgi:hypothetical protein